MTNAPLQVGESVFVLADPRPQFRVGTNPVVVTQIEAGLFIKTEMTVSDQGHQADEDSEYVKPADRSYDFIVHEYFEGQSDKLLPLILYYLPTVNYGDIATYEDAEVFASALMQMEQDNYYQLVCDLTDAIPGREQRQPRP